MSNHISGGNGELLMGVDSPSNEVSCNPGTILDSMVDVPNGGGGNYRRGDGVKVGWWMLASGLRSFGGKPGMVRPSIKPVSW